MATKRHKTEENVTKLRQVDVLVGQGMARIDAIRQVRIVDNATSSNSADPPCARPLPRETVSLPLTNRPGQHQGGEERQKAAGYAMVDRHPLSLMKDDSL